MAFEKNIKSIVHFMAYPGPRQGRSTQLGEAPEKYMVESVEAIAKTNYFSGIEVTIVKDPALRKKMAALYKKKKLFVTFCAQPVQLINEDKLIAASDISSINEIDRDLAVQRMYELIDEAYEIGAEQFCFLSGADPGSANGTRDRALALRSLILSIKQMCRYNRKVAKDLKKNPIMMTLEIFDRSTDTNMKNQLIGPSSMARTIGEELRIDAGFSEFGLLYDLSHMFLIYDGFEHETVDVLYSLAPFLNWIHIANSVSNQDDDKFGDLHPSMNYPAGNVTPEILKDFYTTLQNIDFDNGIGLEVMPYGDELSESVMYDGISAMKQAENQIQVNYAIGKYRFKTRKFLPERLFYKITEFKINRRADILKRAKERKKREYPWNNNLLIVAADHPARHVTNVGSDEIAMGDRQAYLGRILRSLIDEQVDGVMTTPDIVDDLFVIDIMLMESGSPSILDNKLIIGCTNRSGLSGSSYEMDDQITAYRVKEIADLRLDGAKMMFRLDLNSNQARYSQRTMVECADMVRECGEFGIPAFVEPLPVERVDNRYQVKMNHVDMIKTIGVASAIGGAASSIIWLKIPYVDNFELVARSTSNPIMLLGGASTGDPTDTIINFEKGLGAGSNIRGALVGRNLLYPGYDDPLAVTLGVAQVIHKYATAEEAVKYLREQRGKDMEYLTNLLLKEEVK